MEPTTYWTLIVSGVALLCALVGLIRFSRPPAIAQGVVLVLTLLASAALAVIVNQQHGTLSPTLVSLVLTSTALATLAGGGPLTTTVFLLVDGSSDGPTPRPGGVRSAGEVLRGGAWIGALERIAVFSSIACGWPEGIALTLALKGLGRYPELRNEEHSGIAERFLIGTFTSVLWACAWAGVAVVALG